MELVAPDFAKTRVGDGNVIPNLKVLLLLVFLGPDSRAASAYGKWGGSKGGGTNANFL
jgi:hypothetical protein